MEERIFTASGVRVSATAGKCESEHRILQAGAAPKVGFVARSVQTRFDVNQHDAQ
jgi:hypothetical protein